MSGCGQDLRANPQRQVITLSRDVSQLGDAGLKNLMRREILPESGFAAYPWEMVDVFGCVDVVGLRDGRIYAFELKSLNDNASRGVAQCKAYLPYFDYTVLVCVALPGRRIQARLRGLGVGLWWLNNFCREIIPPVHQNHNVDRLVARFHRYYAFGWRKRGEFIDWTFQKTLTEEAVP